MGHEYIDTPQATVDITAKVIKKMYENESLEKNLESDRNFEISKGSWRNTVSCPQTTVLSLLNHPVFVELLHPETYSAIETGAIERFRIDQMTEDDLPQIAAVEKYSAVFPDGGSKQLLG